MGNRGGRGTGNHLVRVGIRAVSEGKMGQLKPITLDDNIQMTAKLLAKFRRIQKPEHLPINSQPCYRKAILHLEIAVQEFAAAEYFRAQATAAGGYFP